MSVENMDYEDNQSSDDEETGTKKVLIQMCNEEGENVGTSVSIPITINQAQLQRLCNAFLQNDEDQLYSFFVNEKEIVSDLESMITKEGISTEGAIKVVYQPQANFKVRAVTRCTSSIEGHSEPVLNCEFSPDARFLATGSGDTSVRFWDLNTETPRFTCKAHTSQILAISWSPDGTKLASACWKGNICLWNPRDGKQLGKVMRGHKKWITIVCWEPLHLNGECRRLASASKDATIKIWDTKLYSCMITLSGHLDGVRCLRWSGEGLIYSASKDRTIKVWRPDDGIVCRTLLGHGLWVNTLALNTDYVMRTGSYEPADAGKISFKEYDAESPESRKSKAKKRYEEVKKLVGHEMMVSGSDDFTLALWNPSENKKHIIRMTGHQNVVNDVRFSPDTRFIASASFDKSVKLWDGKTGKFIASLRGHVNSVYQLAWSGDSRLIVSGSADSTLKVWDVKKKKLLNDLPGHADEVYAVDWSTDGQRVASGGKDNVLKIWRK